MADKDPIEDQSPEEGSEEANPVDPRDPYGIRRNLVRNVITEPLHTKISRKPDKLYNIIIDVNLQYYEGRDAAFTEVTKLAESALGTNFLREAKLPQSVGSSANPFMSALLPGPAIREMVRLDAARIQDRQRRAIEKSKADGGQKPPETSDPYRAIYRIWENFPVHPLIDRSLCTVKADAARRAFAADGRDIVWAVIDSGVDGRHEHFKKGALDLKLPLKHFDFTISGGDGAATALEDKFGHGTHVAGIIAGGVVDAKPAMRAVRSRLNPQTFDVESEAEDITTITGMAPCCRIVSMKVLDDRGQGDVARIIAALDAVQQINDHGRQLLIHGVNLSLGYEFDPRWFACGQSPICNEVNRLARSGVIVVVAAGNTGYGTLSSKARATGAGFMLTINDPGNAEFAITVGSTHRDMPHVYGVSYFSSKGPTGDGRPKPDLLAPGERILSCQSSAKSQGNATNCYVEDTGTSMAAPHVSGVIAAFLSIRKEFIGRPEDVKQLFLSSATDLKRERAFQGYGLVDLMRAIQSV
ncbi:MAG TPA: S8 family peptidase [Candidatus Acidoferrales bacterium]|nr:S8 family peptidase [Candidatus Acidoferrales bacterium]